jgi:hypothetical protein
MDDASGMSDRVKKNFQFAITAVTIQRQVGGSLANLFDLVADTVQRRQFGQIRSLTAWDACRRHADRAAALFMFAISVISPSYLTRSSTRPRDMLLMIGVVLMIVGSLLIKKIVSFGDEVLLIVAALTRDALRTRSRYATLCGAEPARAHPFTATYGNHRRPTSSTAALRGTSSAHRRLAVARCPLNREAEAVDRHAADVRRDAQLDGSGVPRIEGRLWHAGSCSASCSARRSRPRRVVFALIPGAATATSRGDHRRRRLAAAAIGSPATCRTR